MGDNSPHRQKAVAHHIDFQDEKDEGQEYQEQAGVVHRQGLKGEEREDQRNRADHPGEDDARMGELVLKWEVLMNGYVVRLRRTMLNFDHRLETTYYWDETAGKIAFLALSNNGVSVKGFATAEGDELICEGAQHGPDVDRTSRRIYKLDKDGKLYEHDFFRKLDSDSWHRTHVSVFVAK